MKEAIVSPDTKVTIQDSPIPKPGRQEILVKVIIAGTNPKDWQFPFIDETAHNSGDDVSGIVEEVGSEVWEFRKGDRVAGMHAFPEPGGAYAEYAILPAHQTFRLPPNISFEEGATVPLTALTAAFALFYTLELPSSWQRHPKEPKPLLIYGASTAVGAFAIKLAVASSVHPIVAVGNTSSDLTQGFLVPKEGDTYVDSSAFADEEQLIQVIRQAFYDAGVSDGRAPFALDAVSMSGSFDKIVSKAIAGEHINGQKPKLAVVLPGHDYSCADPSVDVLETYTGVAHQGGDVGKRFAYVACRLFALGLGEKWLTPHPYEVREDGLEGLEQVLQDLKAGKVEAKKVLLRIGQPRNSPTAQNK